MACERYNGRLVRVSPEGKRTVLADAWPPSAAGHPGVPLNAPNDLVLRGDGNIYFTDTDWGARPGTPHAPMAVYRVSPTGVLSLVLAMQKPNGIALSPDGGTLYIGSDTQAKVWKLPLDASGAVAAGAAPTVLIDGARVPGGFKVPDGICVDDAGNLYVANNSDEIKAIEVFDAAGELLGRIPFPVRAVELHVRRRRSPDPLRHDVARRVRGARPGPRAAVDLSLDLARALDEDLRPLGDVVGGRDVLKRQAEGGEAGIAAADRRPDPDHPDQRPLVGLVHVGRRGRRAQPVLPRRREGEPDELALLVELLDERRPLGERVGQRGRAAVGDARALALASGIGVVPWSEVNMIVAVASVSASHDLSAGWPAVGVPLVQVDSS